MSIKPLNLDNSKVTISKHLGKYIAGGVKSLDGLGGGGYVFAVKENGKAKILADGNGIILCSSFKDYPDYPAYLVEGCIGDNGEVVNR